MKHIDDALQSMVNDYVKRGRPAEQAREYAYSNLWEWLEVFLDRDIRSTPWTLSKLIRDPQLSGEALLRTMPRRHRDKVRQAMLSGSFQEELTRQLDELFSRP